MVQYLSVFLSVLHGVLAVGVTVHVLLQHENLRSSIGWIGLAWLSPFVGSAVYAMFGINRVRRRAMQLNIPVRKSDGGHGDDPQLLSKRTPAGIKSLARISDAVTRLTLTAGNDAQLLVNGDKAYPAMVEAIDGAQKSVALASYIFSDDEGGGPLVEALIRAHQRGLVVRVLVDGIGSGYLRSPVVSRLRQAGVPVEKFLHETMPWRMSFTNLRNHKKLLILDGQTGFAGGMNIAAENMGGEGEPKVRDVHAKLTGPIVEHLMLNFSADWEFVTGESLSGDIWWPEIKATGDIAMRGISSGPDERARQIETVFLAAVENAQKSVRIVTPYFLPEERVLDVLYRAAMRGVKIQVLVPRKSNHWYFNWAMRGQLERFPLDSIDFRLGRPPFDHSKLMTVDGHWGAIGSANWDARSMRLNFEFVVECYGAGMVREFDAIIDDKLDQSSRLTEDAMKSRTLVARLRDSATRLLLPYL